MFAVLLYLKLFDAVLYIISFSLCERLFDICWTFYMSFLGLMSCFAFGGDRLCLVPKPFSPIFYHGWNIINSHNKSGCISKPRFSYGLTKCNFR